MSGAGPLARKKCPFCGAIPDFYPWVNRVSHYAKKCPLSRMEFILEGWQARAPAAKNAAKARAEYAAEARQVLDRAVRKHVRADALEDAAKIAENFACAWACKHELCSTKHVIAAAIRAEKEKK